MSRVRKATWNQLLAGRVAGCDESVPPDDRGFAVRNEPMAETGSRAWSEARRIVEGRTSSGFDWSLRACRLAGRPPGNRQHPYRRSPIAIRYSGGTRPGRCAQAARHRSASSDPGGDQSPRWTGRETGRASSAITVEGWSGGQFGIGHDRPNDGPGPDPGIRTIVFFPTIRYLLERPRPGRPGDCRHRGPRPGSPRHEGRRQWPRGASGGLRIRRRRPPSPPVPLGLSGSGRCPVTPPPEDRRAPLLPGSAPTESSTRGGCNRPGPCR